MRAMPAGSAMKVRTTGNSRPMMKDATGAMMRSSKATPAGPAAGEAAGHDIARIGVRAYSNKMRGGPHGNARQGSGVAAAARHRGIGRGGAAGARDARRASRYLSRTLLSERLAEDCGLSLPADRPGPLPRDHLHP